MDIHSYDKYIVFFSGGKDSTATFLYLLDQGIPKSKIELWHHDIDGQSGQFMDWECTEDYCRKFANAFGVDYFLSWKEGGFKRELFRQNSLTAPNKFETPGGEVKSVGGVRGKLSTRLKFPQVSPDLSVRWCSSYLKIDVGACAIINQERFRGIRTLVLTGERAEESAARAKYKQFEPHRTDLRNGKRYQRHIDHFRPVLYWSEKKVWQKLESYNVVAHPCYYIGWNRCSCKFCIFGNNNQFYSASVLSKDQFDVIATCESEFGCTIKRNVSLNDLILDANAYISIVTEKEKATQAVLKTYVGEIFTDNWTLPAGAYGENFGPS